MRTTLTVDDDIAVKLKRLANGRSFKEAVNEALRAGLHALEQGQAEPAYQTTSVEGEPRISNIDNIAEVLSELESDNWR